MITAYPLLTFTDEMIGLDWSPDFLYGIRAHYFSMARLRIYQDSKRRALYRKIEAEKKRLVHELGVDLETLRLFCRWRSSLRQGSENKRARRRYANYLRMHGWFPNGQATPPQSDENDL